MKDICFQSLTAQIDAVRRRELSLAELAELHIAHNQRLHPHINALVYAVDPDTIIQQARKAEAALTSGAPVPPLTGALLTVKDSWEVAGVPSTSGLLAREDYLPQQTAISVQRLLDAGAILLGKTNCPELVMPFETDNLVYGRTNNPWNLTCTPGGSSGGEAALIAAGGSPLGIAGDAAASIRTPAHFCGITGIKVTTGRIPRTGHFPTMGGITGPLASAGPMARSVEDLIRVLPILCGGDGVDPACVPVPYYDPDAVPIEQLRVAFHMDNGIMAADDATAETVLASAKALEGAGATITEIVPDGLAFTLPLFDAIFGADGGERVQTFLARMGTPAISQPLQKLLDRLPHNAISTSELMRVLGQLDKLRSQMLGFMERYDVIICPVAAHPAPEHGTLIEADGSARLSYTIPYNLVGYPSASVPVGLSVDGRPIGVQVIAGAWREDRVLAVARHLERAFGGYRPPAMNWLA